MNQFNILPRLPSIVFGIASLIVFIVLLWGAGTLLKAHDDPERIRKGRKILFNAFFGTFSVLLLAFVFYTVSFFLEKGKALQPGKALGEFPLSVSVNFPPAPQIIGLGEHIFKNGVGKYYFNGPFTLKGGSSIKNTAVFGVLCKKDEEYAILYLNETDGAQLQRHSQYQCWLENCQSKKDLSVAILWTPRDNYSLGERKEIAESLQEELKPVCNEGEMLQEN